MIKKEVRNRLTFLHELIISVQERDTPTVLLKEEYFNDEPCPEQPGPL